MEHLSFIQTKEKKEGSKSMLWTGVFSMRQGLKHTHGSIKPKCMQNAHRSRPEWARMAKWDYVLTQQAYMGPWFQINDAFQ